jgi:addiction module HigA family antidote
MNAMTQRNPPHPASILREDVLPALGLTVSDAATQLGVSRTALSRLINEHSGISAEMAARLEKWTSGPSALGWLQMQVNTICGNLAKRGLPKVARAVPGANAHAT